MTEPATTPLIDLHAYKGREISLSYYSFTKTDPRYQEFLAIKAEWEDKMARDEPIYVAFSYDDRREHSVARVKSCKFRVEEHPGGGWGRREVYVYVGIDDIEVVWDKRSNKVRPSTGEIVYYPDWTGGTQWYWNPPEKVKVEPVIAYDHLGQELEIGQNVCFVHRQYGLTSMKFGTVTRFTIKGSVFVKVMKLKDNQYDAGEELKALSMDDVVIVNDALMKRLVMAKLAAN